MKLLMSGLLFLLLFSAAQSAENQIIGKVTELVYLRNRELNLLLTTIKSADGTSKEFAVPVGATLSAAWGNYVLTEADVNRFQAMLSTAVTTGQDVRLVYYVVWTRPASPNHGAATLSVPDYVILMP